jgi:hypothetical protein
MCSLALIFVTSSDTQISSTFKEIKANVDIRSNDNKNPLCLRRGKKNHLYILCVYSSYALCINHKRLEQNEK